MPTLHSLVQDDNFCCGFCRDTYSIRKVEGKKQRWPVENLNKDKDT